MISVSYPEPIFRTKKENGKEFIFDFIRRQWLVLTPEEWVRQNFIQHLIQVKRYPAGMISVEKEIQLGDLKKRFDVLVFDRLHQPWMMIECKASTVSLDETVLQQVLRYNISIPVPFIVITNGHYTHAWEKTGLQLSLLNQLPFWI